MAFDYYGAINQANAINEYAEYIKSYKNEIITIRSSLGDFWKNNVVPQIPELFNDADVNLDNVYWELKRLYNDIVAAANHVRNEEIMQQQEAQKLADEQRKQREAAALAARQPAVVHTTVAVQISEPTPIQTPKKSKNKTTKNTNNTSKKDNSKKDWWPFW